MSKTVYAKKLKDPRWQKKRLQIMERDNWKCLCCGSSSDTLTVHHTAYKGDPWEVPDEWLETLCEGCHDLVQYWIDMCRFMTGNKDPISSRRIIQASSAALAKFSEKELAAMPSDQPSLIFDQAVFYALGFTDSDIKARKK